MYPAGFDIQTQYALSDLSVATSETLTVTRTIVNNESFQITGLYFSENLPEELKVISYSIAVNGADVSYIYYNALSSSILDDFETYRWIVDEPGGTGQPQNALAPGDSLVFQLNLASAVAGQFALPFHTTTFFGNGTGFFSTDEMLMITVEDLYPDTIPPAKIIDLGVVD